MTSLRRVAACLILAILLAPGLVQARPLVSMEPETTVERGFFSLLWDVLIAPWLKNGAELDPSGAPKNGIEPRSQRSP